MIQKDRRIIIDHYENLWVSSQLSDNYFLEDIVIFHHAT
jgi:hypothetical protein